MNFITTSHIKIDENIGMAQGLILEDLKQLRSYYRSCLYLCADLGEESCSSEGFSLILSVFSGNAVQITSSSEDAPFQPSADRMLVLEKFLEYADTLDELSHPTVIVCLSSSLSSAVAVAYVGYKAKLDFGGVLKESEERGYKFLESPGLSHFVRTVVELAVSPSPNHIRIDRAFGIDGTLSAPSLEYLTLCYRSCLYLCSDVGDDSGASEGFSSILSAFSGNAAHIPLVSGESPFQPGADRIVVLEKFMEYAKALDDLARPTVVVCKSARRASAVVVAYEGYKGKLDVREVMNEAIKRQYKFLESAGLQHFVLTVLESSSQAEANKEINSKY